MKVVFRTDASTQIGSGHVMRCLTLAEGLRDKGVEVRFVCRELPGNLNAMIAAKGFALWRLPASGEPAAGLDWNRHANWLVVDWRQDVDETLACLHALDGPADWLVVDHYALDRRWEVRMRPVAGNIMVIDDLADREHDADLLLDQNLYAQMETRYQGYVPAKCRQLLGPGYALLRSEFAAARRGLRQRRGELANLLIFYGGGDPTDETSKALTAIKHAQLPDFQVDVVVGAANPNKDKVAERCRLLGARFHCQTSDMAELMNTADLMLCAGGTTTWERCALGVPALVTATALNQEEVAVNSARNGLAFYLGKPRDVTAQLIAKALAVLAALPETLQLYAEKARAAVDGRGVQRVVAILVAPRIALRPAVWEDCDAVHQWRNAEETRRYIFDPEPIPLDAHRRWFRAALDNHERILLIGKIGEIPIGVVRYDLAGDEALISVYLVPGMQGQGLGPRLIDSGSDWLKQNYRGVRRIKAEIMRENRSSIKAFELAGYSECQRIYQKVLQ